MALELKNSGGDLAGTLCNNPYTSYAYAGGMYDTPITGSDGSALYVPTGVGHVNRANLPAHERSIDVMQCQMASIQMR